MTEGEFHELAARALAAEANEEELARLENAMALDSRWRNEFADLSAAWAVVKEAGPLADALAAKAGPAPRARVKSWMAAVENQLAPPPNEEPVPGKRSPENDPQHKPGWLREWFRISPRAFAAMLLGLAVLAGLLLWQRAPRQDSSPIAYVVPVEAPVELLRRGTPTQPSALISTTTALRTGDEIRLASGASASLITPAGTVLLRGPGTFPAGHPDLNVEALPPARTNGTEAELMRIALFQSPELMPPLLVTTRSSQGIPIYSPVGFTADLTPLILWKGAPGVSYDVTIADEFSSRAPRLRATGVTSPVQFTNAWGGRTLGANGLYRLTIAEIGNPIASTEIMFRTLAPMNGTESAASADGLRAAYESLAANPPRFGDALARLLVLPPGTAESELALRLKIFAFARLGYHDDFHAALRQLAKRR